MTSEDPVVEEFELRKIRKAKLDVLRAQGQAFPNDFRRTDMAEALQADYGASSKEAL